MRSVYLLPVIGAIFGGLQFLSTFVGSQSAPQQAAGAAMAVAWAVLPYVFARAMVELSEQPREPTVTGATGRGIQPEPPAPTPLSIEEATTLKAKRTRRFLVGLLLVLALGVFYGVALWNAPPRQPGFYERNPGAP